MHSLKQVWVAPLLFVYRGIRKTSPVAPHCSCDWLCEHSVKVLVKASVQLRRKCGCTRTVVSVSGGRAILGEGQAIRFEVWHELFFREQFYRVIWASYVVDALVSLCVDCKHIYDTGSCTGVDGSLACTRYYSVSEVLTFGHPFTI